MFNIKSQSVFTPDKTLDILGSGATDPLLGNFANTQHSPLLARPAPLSLDEVKERVRATALRRDVLLDKVIPSFLLKDHAGACVCVSFNIKNAHHSISSLYYTWDLPSLTHKQLTDGLDLFMHTVLDEKSAEIAERTLSRVEQVRFYADDLAKLVEDFIEDNSEEGLRELITEQDSYLVQMRRYPQQAAQGQAFPQVTYNRPQLVGSPPGTTLIIAPEYVNPISPTAVYRAPHTTITDLTGVSQ